MAADQTDSTAAASSLSTTPPDPKVYYGNCHCGAFQFHITLPLPLSHQDSPPLHQCHCSVCAKKGYLFIFPQKSAVIVDRGHGQDRLGRGVLTDYDFNSKQLWHRFCGTCGTPVGIVHKTIEEGGDGAIALNVRLFRAVDGLEGELARCKVKLDPGPQRSGAYQPPRFEEPANRETEVVEAEAAAEKIYPGSCHCGGVRYRLQSKRLDREDAFDIRQCDCSICQRNAYILTYPTPLSRVHIDTTGPAVLTTYFNPSSLQAVGWQFCSVCGVPLFGDIGEPAPGAATEWSAELTERVAAMRHLRPLNLRTLDLFLGRTAEDRAEWQAIVTRVVRIENSKRGKRYQVPE